VSSFEAIDTWLNEVHDYTTKNTVVILIGNKIDLKDQRKVESRRAEEYVLKNGLYGYFEVSAKDGTNVAETFNKLITKVIDAIDNSSI
jgi:GTPase SAR1 family protein